MKFSVLNDFYLNYLDRDKIRHSANLYWSHQKRQNTFALYILFEFFFSQCCVTDKHPKDPFLQIHFSAVRPFIWQSKYWLLLSEQHLNQMKNLYNEDAHWGLCCMWNDLGLLHCTIPGVLQNIHSRCKVFACSIEPNTFLLFKLVVKLNSKI